MIVLVLCPDSIGLALALDHLWHCLLRDRSSTPLRILSLLSSIGTGLGVLDLLASVPHLGPVLLLTSGLVYFFLEIVQDLVIHLHCVLVGVGRVVLMLSKLVLRSRHLLEVGLFGCGLGDNWLGLVWGSLCECDIMV